MTRSNDRRQTLPFDPQKKAAFERGNNHEAERSQRSCVGLAVDCVCCSAPDYKNGLYWEAKTGEEISSLGPFAARAVKEGYGKNQPSDRPSPYHGYYYRILSAQGKDAAGGACSYLVKGSMVGGFALVAYPAEYGNSGIMTFIVNHDGKVFQKDLGKNTAAVASAMKQYNPDSTWSEVKE